MGRHSRLHVWQIHDRAVTSFSSTLGGSLAAGRCARRAEERCFSAARAEAREVPSAWLSDMVFHWLPSFLPQTTPLGSALD